MTVKLYKDGYEYDIVTVEQFARMSGKTHQHVYNMIHRIRAKHGDTQLDIVHPFPRSEKKEDERTGPRFILINDKAREVLHKKKKTKK